MVKECEGSDYDKWVRDGRMVGKRLRRREVGWLKNGREAINTNGGGMVT